MRSARLTGLIFLCGFYQAAAATSPSVSTCVARTVNHITHTLPQQCLATHRTSRTDHNEHVWSHSAGDENHDQASRQISASRQVSITASEGQHKLPDHTQVVLGQDPISMNQDTAAVKHVTSATSEVQAVSPSAEPDSDSPLDNANFLSFEEWKKQNLAKAGQNPDLGKDRLHDDKASRPRPGAHNGLETLGEDSEIELDFAGFGPLESPSDVQVVKATKSALVLPIAADDKVASPMTARSRDAGKTCKERTNYASFDCAATVLKTNRECKSSSSVLIENKDSYMLNVCSASDKHLIVELCDDILIDTVVLANYEFFSSIFRTFRVSVSDRYPPKGNKWRDVGVYEARNTRQVQAFLIEQPLIWARFIRIDFLTHYGHEYYCPVSLFRVHGTTMMEEFRHQEEGNRGDDADDLGTVDQASSVPAQEPLASSQAADQLVVTGMVKQKEASRSTSSSIVSPTSQGSASTTAFDLSKKNLVVASQCPNAPDLVGKSSIVCKASDWKLNTHSSTATLLQEQDRKSSSVSHVSQVSQAKAASGTASVSNAVSSTETSIPVALPSVASAGSANSQPHVPAEKMLPDSSSGETNRQTQTSMIIPHPPQATTQESFFKSVHKRLQMLESNATLSLQYIEEQSRILRDAFAKVEKRQVNRTETLLSSLNKTVSAEMAVFKQQYDQLCQSTVIELETHREQYQRELLAVSSRLNLVAEELLFQKRMVIVQSTLLILCLGLVIFAKYGGSSAPLEMPLLQQILEKSGANHARRYASHLYSPPTSPSRLVQSPSDTSLDAHNIELEQSAATVTPLSTSWRHSWSNTPTNVEAERERLDRDEEYADTLELNFQPPTPESTPSSPVLFEQHLKPTSTMWDSESQSREPLMQESIIHEPT